MPNKMLIDATHPEETRVVVVRGNRVEEFDFESAQRKQLRGNIYLAKVTRVEPSLQAAFIEYGGNRHGFLAFSEIHPDYYQIPVADRQALIEADERAHREAEEESENRSSRRRPRHRNSRRRGGSDRVQSDVIDGAVLDGAALDASGGPQPDVVHVGDHDAEPSQHHADDVAEHHDHAGEAHATHDVSTDGDHHASGETPATASPAHEDHEHDDHEHDDHAHDDHAHEDDEAHHHADAASERSAAPQGDDHLEERHADDTRADEAHGDEAHPDDEHGEEAEEDIVESVGGDDVMEEVPERAFRPRRQYKIQEVIKRRQVMLVQVVKEERGNKGAALTTYLSLAGRYAVLMPNTARGGGISRKITSAQDRSRLKEVVSDLDVPEGMGIILRTAGAARTKPEIKRDFEYLIRMWETVRDMTLKSQAPTLVYEEGSLIKRSLRDLYNKEIDEVMVAGEPGYNEARDFMKMLMPTNVRSVKQYRDGQPLFSRMGVESQLDAMFSPTVTLRSGGYIVINQTEALVSIDVNSGRSTREHHIEDTALKTNLEAAEEVARQLRLRDLAGLIVIDFIDMDEKRNNRAVERKMSDCLRQDRARIQVGRISHFGLLEMSRQRIRASVLESSTEPCPHCGGSGHVRSVASVALQLLRGLEENLMKGPTHNLTVRTRTDVALYVLNHKRGHLRDLESSFKVTLAVIADPTVSGQQSFVIDRGELIHTPEAARAILAAQVAAFPPEVEDTYEYEEEDDGVEADGEFEADDAEDTLEVQPAGETADGGGEAPKRKRRRRRRGGRGEGRDGAPESDQTDSPPLASDQVANAAEPDADGEDDAEETDGDVAANPTDANGERRPRRRGRRGGRRRRGGPDAPNSDEPNADGSMPDRGIAATIADDFGPVGDSEAAPAVADLSRQKVVASHDDRLPTDNEAGVKADDSDQPRRRSTVREKVSFLFGGDASAEPATPAIRAEPEAVPTQTSAAPSVEPAKESAKADQPRRAGWWSKKSSE